jgi:hypothetical protein
LRKLSPKAMRGAEVERGLAPSAPLTDGVGSVLDREVYFPLAGYAGPGFHNWPGSADVLVGEYETGDSHPKKTFGKAFGAATGVSDPRLQKTTAQGVTLRWPKAGRRSQGVFHQSNPATQPWQIRSPL